MSEAVGLDDVRMSARKGVLRILGKGEKVREVPIHPQLHRDLAHWLDERPTWPGAISQRRSVLANLPEPRSLAARLGDRG